MSEMGTYLRCTVAIDCDAESVASKARELTEGLETAGERVAALFYFVRDRIKHNPYAPGLVLGEYKASGTMERGNGHCHHKAILLVALGRAAGIPSRLGFVDMRDHLVSANFREVMGGDNRFPFHGYAELFVGGRWVHLSPAYDADVCRKNRFVPVEFDGVNDAKDSPRNQDGDPHIEHIRDHGPYDDYPMEEIHSYYREWWPKMGFDWDEKMTTWAVDSEG